MPGILKWRWWQHGGRVKVAKVCKGFQATTVRPPGRRGRGDAGHAASLRIKVTASHYSSETECILVGDAEQTATRAALRDAVVVEGGLPVV